MAQRIIAIETSGRRGSAALALDGELVAEADFVTNAEHARDLLPVVDGLIQRAGGPFIGGPGSSPGLDQCYISIGPGSFTGLRVAVTFSRHLALALGVRIIAVPTLDVIAENAQEASPPPHRLAVVLDAKRAQVFGAVFEYRSGAYSRLSGPLLIEPSALLSSCPQPDTGVPAVIGEGVSYHRAAIETCGGKILDEALWWPRASMVHRLGWRMAAQGQFTPARDLIPLYVRRPEAEELWEKRMSGKAAGGA